MLQGGVGGRREVFGFLTWFGATSDRPSDPSVPCLLREGEGDILVEQRREPQKWTHVREGKREMQGLGSGAQ